MTTADLQSTQRGTATSFLLKILSGPHQGAEVELPSDVAIVVGSDGTCDLVLSDALIAGRHFEFFQQEDGMYLRPLEGNVFLSGKLVRTESSPVAVFEFITVGTTQMILGPAGENWPAISISDAPELESITEETPAETLSGENLAGLPEEEAQEISEDNVKKAGRRRSRRIIAFGLLLLLGGLGLVALLPTKKHFNLADFVQIIQARISNMEAYSGVHVSTQNGQLIVEGYVATNEELKNLRNETLKIYPTAQIRVRSDERVITEIEDILSHLDEGLTVTKVQPGVFSIGGYIHDTEEWQKLRNRLARDIRGVKKIQDDILSPEKVQAMSAEVFNQNGLVNQIQVLPREDRVVFQGEIGMAQQENWKKTAEALIEMFNDIVPIEFDVRLSGLKTQQQGNRFFGAAVQGLTVASNGLGWVTLQNGRKYFEGAYLPSGYTIEEISVDGIVFSRNNRQVRVTIEELQQ